MTKTRPDPPELSPLEARVMELLWTDGELTADDVRRKLGPSDELTDSSVRTLLRRLETKEYVEHTLDGKRFLFRARIGRPHAAAAAVRRIIATICGGAVDSLLIGMVDSKLLSRKELERVRKRLAEDEPKTEATDE